MPTLSELLVSAAVLPPSDIEWLHLLVGDWQLLADLSFADLVLWVPLYDGQEWLAVAQCRPSTGPTAFHDDLVGKIISAGANQLVATAWAERRSARERDPHWNDDVPIRQEAIPVQRGGHLLAVLSRHSNMAAVRTPSRLELTYVQCADDLARMVSEGAFPAKGEATGNRRGAPRAGDGLVRLDRDGRIVYVTPNAISALHRIGHVGDTLGLTLAQILDPLRDSGSGEDGGVAERVDESLPLVLEGRAPWYCDIEVRGVALSLRAIPLTRNGTRFAAMVLTRDVTELRRRERELITKDATIREVHHRVKNNLQTVAALLRLQARRISSADGRDALQEAMRRVSTIATVHELLSETLDERVDFDQVVDRTVSLAVELARSDTAKVSVHREGSFGPLDAINATPLALVLTELVANAVEHGLGDSGGDVTVMALREGRALRIVVRDDGQGLPEGFRPGAERQDGTHGLGTQIVQALVSGEMRGRISWHDMVGGGTEVVVDVTLRTAAPGSRRPMGAGREDAGRPSGRSPQTPNGETRVV